MTHATPLRPLALVVGLASVLLVSGCGIGTPAGPGMLPGANLTGNVHGGQNPVSSSNVALFATGKDTASG